MRRDLTPNESAWDISISARHRTPALRAGWKRLLEQLPQHRR
jgi:hypothetical protein